ncbi:MAG: hypothetical protein GY754_27580 [bacterium]|nr:hypothetical protein [bacterium]
MKTINCDGCGAPLRTEEETKASCPYCHTENTISQQAGDGETTTTVEAKENKSKKNHIGCFIALLLIIVIAIAAVFIYRYFILEPVELPVIQSEPVEPEVESTPHPDAEAAEQFWGETTTEQLAAIRKEIKKINGLFLKVRIVDNASDNDCYENIAKIYYDPRQRIRKVISNYEYTCAKPAVGKLTEYFDASGNCIFLYFLQHDPSNIARGNTYYYQNRVIRNDSHVYIPGSENKKPFTLPRYKSLESDPDLEGLELRYHENTSLVQDHYKTEGVSYKGKYTFCSADRDSISVINSNRVSFRSGPTSKSERLCFLAAYADIKIIKIGIQEDLAPWGRYPWYQIKLRSSLDPCGGEEEKTGWVFGAFVAPFECDWR